MLKLKKLQILGFKSFCDRTELKFHGDGIAAIVGPNGCGKSNISDAISWVLGEQSAKSLRGARMEDVIFAGTRDRKPTGMAEVSLTLIDPAVYDGADPAAETEIEIKGDLPQDDWDEASLRTQASDEAERYIEEVRPLDPVEVAAAPANAVEAVPANETAAIAGPEDDPANDEPTKGHAETAPPQVVLRIRRRTFKRREFKAGEIVVTRRLFRSGESDYLLNGKLCRLRDIQDIFMGTGLGPESYAIIEQGRIGQILSSKPHDRRAIIEEAAGITKFKTKKRLAEARLEQAKLNLSRVNDIFDEVTRQMNSLKRQAAKAERYAKLRDELRARLRVVLASKFSQITAEAAGVQTQLDAISEDIRHGSEAVQQLDNEHQGCAQRGYEIESEARLTADRLAAITREIDRAHGRRANNEERCADLAARSVAAEAELQQGESQRATLEWELQQNREVLAGAAVEVGAAQEDAERLQLNAAEAANRLREVEAEQERRRAELMQTIATAATIHNQITQAQEHAASLDRDSQRVRQELENATNEIEASGGRRGQQVLEFESASQRVAALAEQIADTRQKLAHKRADESESKMRLDTLRAEYASALGKRASLEAVIAEHGYSTESVRRLFQSGALQGGKAPVGVLADFLEVDQQYEHVVEDFLRDELNYIVVKSWDAADQGLQVLRGDVDGRATFLVHPNDSQAKFSFLVDESLRPAPPRESIVPLSRCIRVLNGFGKSLEVILPKLRDGYIVPENSLARELALESPDAFFLAKSGECFHNVTVTGGKQRTEGPLSMKRELRDVARLVNDLENALREQETRVALLGRKIAEFTSLLERLEAEKLEAERNALTTGHTLKQLDQEIGRATERIQTYHCELERIAAERSAKREYVETKQAELEGHEQHRDETEQAMVRVQEEITVLRMDRDLASQNAAEMKSELAVLQERHRAAAATVQRLESMVAEVAVRVAALCRQIEAARAEKLEREQQNAQIAEQLVALEAEGEAARQRASALQSEAETVRQRLANIEEQLKTARRELDAVRDRRSELSTALARLQSDLGYLRQNCVNELGATPEELLEDSTLVLLQGEMLPAEEGVCREMRVKLEAMGPVNMMALEEYTETAQRHEFLETQRKDLLDSIENTQCTIKEIEVVSRQKFHEAFEHINENFQRTFTKLFGGGSAFMRLTDEEQGAESGIDIVASPPGKKLQSVLLLSGGEKALTALSLLVGIFQYQPSPFCILDEVDAPLDEANVARFVEMVREMSAQTQFVLITHSKKTMSAAPLMYGVTMQEPGVSKVVSVRFGGEAIAASA